MADDEHLKILTQGVEVWNSWRGSHPDFQPDLTDADLMNAKLGGADLTDADLMNAKLGGADLAGANLTEANLTRAALSNADLTGAKLLIADLTGTNLTGADFTGAKLRDAIFKITTVNGETRGLEGLTEGQRAGLIHVARPPDAGAQSDGPGRVTQITVGTAQHIIGPAHEVLIRLSIPNDLSEAHRELFFDFRRNIEDLQQIIAGLRDENRRLSDESEELRQKLDAALPLWKRAWETFVLKGAETAGQGAVFTAGFIAGATYSAFTAEAPGIPI